jgi:capsular exopolysaccharide synthesis family protein
MQQLTTQFAQPAAVERDFDVGQLPAILWRRKWIIVSAVAIGLMLAKVVVDRLEPVYTANTQLIISPEQPVLDVQSVAAALRGDDQATASEVFVLRSHDLAERVVDTLDLVGDPEFNPTLRPRKQSWWARLFGDDDVDTRRAAPVLTADEQRNLVASVLLGHIEAVPEARSRVMSLTAHAGTPEKAALIANTVAAQYLSSQIDTKRDTTSSAQQWLTERTRQLEGEVRDREAEVEAYRASKGLLRGAGAARLTDEEASELSSQLVTARAERAAADARLGSIEKLLHDSNANAASDVLDSPLVHTLREQQASLRRDIAQLSEQYGPMHPRILNAKAQLRDTDKAIKAELAKVVSGLRNDSAVAHARENSIAASIDSLKTKAGSRSSNEVHLQALERDADTSRALLETFLTRTKETAAQSSHMVADARIISRAIPPFTPSFPRPHLLEFIAGMAALLIGTVIALAREGMDRTVRSRVGLEQLLGTPVLAALPQVRGRRIGFHPPVRWVLRAPRSEYSEALRRMYTQLTLADLRNPPRVVLFTSPLPGEGKTTTMLALGRLLAGTGRRVVTVDLNLRKPTLHAAAGVSASSGLGEWFRAADDRPPPLYPDPLSTLQVLPAGRLYVDPGVLLTSDRFEGLLATLRRDFDVVLLDSSPLLAVVDAQVLACAVDATVLLVRAGQTTRASAAEAYALLERACTTPLHVVLNAARQRDEVPAYGHGLAAYYPDMAPRRGRLAGVPGALPASADGSGSE